MIRFQTTCAAVILLLALLAGCGAGDAAGESAPAGSGGAAVSGTQVPAGEGDAPYDIYGELAEALERDLLDHRVEERLRALGISAAASALEMDSPTTFSFLLTLSGEGGEHAVPMTGRCTYDTFVHEEYSRNLNMAWGGVTVLDDDTVAAVGERDILFYTPDLTPVERALATDGIDGDFALCGVGFVPELGFFTPYFAGGRDHIAYYGADGGLLRTQDVQYTLSDYSHLFGAGYAGDIGEPVARFVPVFEHLALAAPHLTMPRGGYSVLLNTETGIARDCMLTLESEDGDRRAALYSLVGSYGGGYTPPDTPDTTHLALYYERGALRGHFLMDGRDIHPLFGSPEEEYNPDYPGLTHMWSEDARVALYCPYTDLTLLLDFEGREALLQYDIKEAHLRGDEVLAVSPDGRYALYLSSLSGAGDVGYANVVLRDTETGALRCLGQWGGMYGGYGNEGFFQNGDIYLQSLDRLRVFSTDPQAPSPLLEFAMPLGYRWEEGLDRGLLTFRRNPEELDFIVLYYEMPDDGGYGWDQEMPPYKADANYLVGYCDAAGNLLESFDTGMPVLSDQFGLCAAGFSRSGDELTITVGGRRDSVAMQGVFDLATGVFTDHTPEPQGED